MSFRSIGEKVEPSTTIVESLLRSIVPDIVALRRARGFLLVMVDVRKISRVLLLW